MGKVEPMERRRPTRRTGESAFANPDVASARVGVCLGKRERRIAAGKHSQGISSDTFRTSLAKRLRRYRLVFREGSQWLSLIHISEPTRLGMISYAVFCL